jgi:hypothetical protein
MVKTFLLTEFGSRCLAKNDRAACLQLDVEMSFSYQRTRDMTRFLNSGGREHCSCTRVPALHDDERQFCRRVDNGDGNLSCTLWFK